MKKLLVTTLFGVSLTLSAQEPPPASVRISTLASAPTVDGMVDEAEWSGATVIDQPFIQFQPDYAEPSPFRTVVRIAQTDSALHIAFEAFDPDMERLSAARTQRDGGLGNDDSVIVMLDTFHDGRTAYLFQTNALGTQEDNRIANNGRTIDVRWDAS